jgi:hypothetical protein
MTKITRELNQCYICGEEYSKKDISDKIIVCIDGKYVHTKHHGVKELIEKDKCDG